MPEPRCGPWLLPPHPLLLLLLSTETFLFPIPCGEQGVGMELMLLDGGVRSASRVNVGQWAAVRAEDG